MSVQSVAGKNPSAKRIKVEEAAQVSVSGNSGNLNVNEKSADLPSAIISPSTLPVDTCRDPLDPVVTRETNLNWQLEGVVRQIQKLFSIDLKNKDEFGSFSVQQRNVWGPYSLWTSFVFAAEDGFTTIVGNTFNYAMKMELKKTTIGRLYEQRAFSEASPQNEGPCSLGTSLYLYASESVVVITLSVVVRNYL